MRFGSIFQPKKINLLHGRKILLLLCFVCFFVQGKTQMFKINQYNIFYDKEFYPIGTLFTNFQFNEKLGFTNYFYVNAHRETGWGEALFGLTYSPVKILKIGLIGGFQTNEHEIWRVAPIIFFGKGPITFSGVFEFGGERYRWDAMMFYNLKHFRFGWEGIRYYKMYAIGPRLEIQFTQNPSLNIFYSALFDVTYGKFASMVGIYAVFK